MPVENRPELAIDWEQSVWIKAKNRATRYLLVQLCPDCALRKDGFCRGINNVSDNISMSPINTQKELRRILKLAACRPAVDPESVWRLPDDFTELVSRLGCSIIPYAIGQSPFLQEMAANIQNL